MSEIVAIENIPETIPDTVIEIYDALLQMMENVKNKYTCPVDMNSPNFTSNLKLVVEFDDLIHEMGMSKQEYIQSPDIDQISKITDILNRYKNVVCSLRKTNETEIVIS